MKKITAILCAAALAALALPACGARTGPAQLLAGKWDGSVGLLEFQAMEFVPDEEDPLRGRVDLSLVSNFIDGSYEVFPPDKRGEPGRLKITYTLSMFSTTNEYAFTVDGDTLTLLNERTNVTLTYKRAP